VNPDGTVITVEEFPSKTRVRGKLLPGKIHAYTIIDLPSFTPYRNPSVKSLVYATSPPQAPHVTTNNQTYTVPSARSALICGGIVQINRVTAASSAGRVSAFCAVGGLTSFSVICSDNVVGHTLVCQIPFGMPVITTVVIGDGDGSTGGTVDYLENVAILEFDI
jgi:hypothetical protein